jgi:hypothetical protein
MRKALIVILCLLVIGGAGANAVWQLWLKEKVHRVIAEVSAASGNRETKTGRPQVPDDPNFGTYRDPITDEIEAYRAEVNKGMAARDFAGLDTLADEARAKRLRFGMGSWRIAQFYDTLELSAKLGEDVWQERLAMLREWQQQRPLSITARVALADALTDYAWKARGTEYAPKVKQAGWKLFGERLAEAWAVLKDARQLPAKDPYWWSVAQTVALGQQWEREDYDKLFREAIAYEPEFWGYYIKKAHYLLPRWNGKPGEWESFAEESINEPGGLGPEVYARIVINMNSYYQQIFHESKARWDLTKAGFETIRERYPDSTEMLSEFAMLATQGNDAKCSREMFDALGDRIDRRAWKSKDRYLYYYRYSHPEAK